MKLNVRLNNLCFGVLEIWLVNVVIVLVLILGVWEKSERIWLKFVVLLLWRSWSIWFVFFLVILFIVLSLFDDIFILVFVIIGVSIFWWSWLRGRCWYCDWIVVSKDFGWWEISSRRECGGGFFNCFSNVLYVVWFMLLVELIM